MARYFFHVMNGRAVLDSVGAEMADMDQVRTEAIRTAGQMLSDGKVTWTGQAWQMIVTDDRDVIVLSLSFAVDRHGR